MLRRGLALLLRRRDFGALMSAQFLAQAGDGIVQAAIAKLIVFGGQKGFDLEDARSPDEILRIVLYVFVPYTILSPLLGVVIDRWDRRRLLVVANGLRAVVMVLVALAGTKGVGDIVMFGAFLLTIASTRVVLATKSAALPETLGGEFLVEGNAVSQLGGALFQLGGAGVSVLAAEFVEVDPIVLAGALVYAGGAVCALFIRHAGLERVRSTFARQVAQVFVNIAAGVREVARTPKAGAAITTYFWLRWLWSFSLVGIGFVARELLDDEDLRVLVITGGAGALGAGLGFLMASRLHDRVRSTARLVFAGSLLGGGAVLILGAFGTQISLAALALCLGFGFFLAKISLDTLVQEALGDDFRGRAFSLYDIAYNIAWVLAAAVMKAAWQPGGQGAVIASMGAVFVVGLGVLAVWYRRAGLLGVDADVTTAVP